MSALSCKGSQDSLVVGPRAMRREAFVPALFAALACSSLAWATSPGEQENDEKCDLAIVGAGVGGAYAAWRASAEGHRVCIFERSTRPGGRIHSLRNQGPKKDLIVEAGGYRFAPKPVEQRTGKIVWKIATPLTAKIVKELGLHAAIYNPDASQWDHGMRKLVDAAGNDVGYLTLVERLLELAVANGTKVRYRTPIVALDTAQAGVAIMSSTGEQFLAKTVLLNIPQRPLIELLRNSGHDVASVFPKPLYGPVSFPIMKLYVHYEDAWWRNDLGLVSGPFYNKELPSPIEAHVAGLPAEEPVPLQGQYHDGNVRCDLENGRCRGYLQAYYGGDNSQNPGGVDGAIKFFAPFADAVREDSVVHIGKSAAHHVELLKQIHASLVQFHHDALEAANMTNKVSAMMPTDAVLSLWSEGVAGIHGGCHMPKRLANGSVAPPGAYSKAALQPLPNLPIFVANEAFGPMQCFAEGSLAMSESALLRMNIGSSRPGWLSEEFRATLLDPATHEGRPPTDPALFFPMMEPASEPDDSLLI